MKTMSNTTEDNGLDKVRRERVRRVIGKLGWLGFAGYAAASLCGAEKVARATGALTVACTVIANGMKVVEDIHDIMEA
jgi:hypothetical protein